jgi:hypothetical protein
MTWTPSVQLAVDSGPFSAFAAMLLDVGDPAVDAVSLMTPIGAAEWSMAPRTTQGPA